jgi:cystathionine beta-lyase
MEAALTADTRLLLLCHPHNPVGRAWTADELAELAIFCKQNDLLVCSDEIHCDLLLDAGRQHIPLASIDSDMASRCITLMAPSKTYNIPGLGCAFAVISDAALRHRFCGVMRGIVPDVNVLGLTAAEAAYRDCADWRMALLEVLRGNRDCVEAAVAAMPGLRMTHVEATYLAWIDARGLGVDNPVAFFEAAGVGLSNGSDFGLPGWVRLNFGCPGTTLESALQRMISACSRVM